MKSLSAQFVCRIDPFHRLGGTERPFKHPHSPVEVHSVSTAEAELKKLCGTPPKMAATANIVPAKHNKKVLEKKEHAIYILKLVFLLFASKATPSAISLAISEHGRYVHFPCSSRIEPVQSAFRSLQETHKLYFNGPQSTDGSGLSTFSYSE